MAKKTVNVEEVYAEYQMIMKQIQVCDQQLQQVDMQSQEFMIAIESMNELGNSKSGEEFLSPIASGIFVRGTILDIEKVIINVGGNVASEKTLSEAKTLMQTQIDDLARFREKLMNNRQMLLEKYEELRSQIAE